MVVLLLFFLLTLDESGNPHPPGLPPFPRFEFWDGWGGGGDDIVPIGHACLDVRAGVRRIHSAVRIRRSFTNIAHAARVHKHARKHGHDMNETVGDRLTEALCRVWECNHDLQRKVNLVHQGLHQTATS